MLNFVKCLSICSYFSSRRDPIKWSFICPEEASCSLILCSSLTRIIHVPQKSLIRRLSSVCFTFCEEDPLFSYVPGTVSRCWFCRGYILLGWSFLIVPEAIPCTTFIALLYFFALKMLSLEMCYLPCESRYIHSELCGIPCKGVAGLVSLLWLYFLFSFGCSRKSLQVLYIGLLSLYSIAWHGGPIMLRMSLSISM